jgi:hypothetical protein
MYDLKRTNAPMHPIQRRIRRVALHEVLRIERRDAVDLRVWQRQAIRRALLQLEIRINCVSARGARVEP